MKKTTFILVSFCFLFKGITAQTIVVPPDLNQIGFPVVTAYYTDLKSFVDSDTSESGEQLHDTYLLEAGGLYFIQDGVAKWESSLTFKATGDIENNGKPLIQRYNPLFDGTSIELYRGKGNLTFDGIMIVLGPQGAESDSYSKHPIILEGDNQKIVFKNCQLLKSGDAMISCRGELCNVIIKDSHLYNMGVYERFGDYGSIVDVGTTFSDSIIIHNNAIHNIYDRVVKSNLQKGLNYFEFSQNTLFNHMGRNGMIQLKNTKSTIIQNNVFSNPSIFGTSSFLADEQINHFGITNYLISIDTIDPDATIEITNNNVFWTQDVLDHYETSDSVAQPEVISPELTSFLSNPENAFFTEVLELNNVPDRQRLIDYAKDAINFKDSVGLPNIMVEDIVFQGSPLDKGYIFDFALFNPCYPENTMSHSAATDGGRLGYRTECGETVNTKEVNDKIDLNLRIFPNPSDEEVQIKYYLPYDTRIKLIIYDLNGDEILTVKDDKQKSGEYTAFLDIQNLVAGTYVLFLETEQDRKVAKMVVH